MAANPKESEKPETLSEAQRLAQLEKTVSLNRIISMLVAIALVIAISVGITVLIFNSLNKGPISDYGEQISRLELEITALKNENQTYRLKMEQIEKQFPELRGLIQNSSAATFQKLLIQQEASYQQFMNALKAGMYDLAHMVQGSRTWLEHYNEELNKSIEHSVARQRELQKLQTGTVLVEPDAQ